ncbi:hypothetical protein MKW94_028762 [Papaver nudicaule]|uniref:Uncharacterized protein n=1 Tax=Papaver nudicaule TaxID=74823 RepID=A0AA41VSQ1_PAPNU|nr:hypothetical protein [Papaver nudicaule]
MEHLTTHLHRPRTTRSPQNERGDGGIVPFEPFFMLFPAVISQRLDMGRKKGGTSTLGERSTTESCMLRSGRMNRSRKRIY